MNILLANILGYRSVASAELVTLIAALSGKANNAIFDNRRAFTGVPTINDWRVPDLSGNGNTGAQAFATRWPGINPTLGATFDGSDDAYGYAWQGGAPTSITAVLRLRKSVGATGKRLLSDGTTNAAQSTASYNSGSAVVTGGTVTVDGVSTPTQGALYTALNDGLDHTVVVAGVSTSAWVSMFISRITGAHEGSIFKVVIIDETTSNLAAARSAAVAYVASSA